MQTVKVAVGEDHPRVGGEKFVKFFFNNCNQGSPPRRRGKAIEDAGIDYTRRITPA